MQSSKESNVFSWLDGLAFNRFHILMLLLTGLTLTAAGFSLQTLAYAMPLMVREWGLSPVRAGTMVSWGFAGLMVGAVGFGAVSDRIGRKKSLMAAVSVFSIAGSAASLAPGYTSFCLLRFLTGVGIGGAFPLAVALLSEFSPAGSRARLVTAAVSGFTLGWATAATASMALIPLFGWRPVFGLGILFLLLLPFIRTSVPESVRFLVEKGLYLSAMNQLDVIERVAGTVAVRRTLGGPVSLAPAVHKGLVDLFRGRLAVMTILVWSTYLLNTMVLYGLSVWLPSLLVNQGFSLVKSYTYAMVQAGGAAFGGLALGLLMDRFGRKSGLVLTYLLGGFAVVFFGLARTDFHLFLAGAATGIFVVGTPTALNVVCSEIYPTGVRSTGIASAQAAGRIGSIMGPLAGGMLQAFEVSFHQFFLLFAVPCFACMLLAASYPVNVRGEALEAVSGLFRYSKE